MNFIPPSVKIPNALLECLSRPLQSFEYKMFPTGSRGWTVVSHAGGIILRNPEEMGSQSLGSHLGDVLSAPLPVALTLFLCN